MAEQLSEIPSIILALAKQQLLDDHTYNELVQAVGIIRAAADGAKCNMEDGLPVDHTQNYETILRQVDRLSKVIHHVRGYGSVTDNKGGLKNE